MTVRADISSHDWRLSRRVGRHRSPTGYTAVASSSSDTCCRRSSCQYRPARRDQVVVRALFRDPALVQHHDPRRIAHRTHTV